MSKFVLVTSSLSKAAGGVALAVRGLANTYASLGHGSVICSLDEGLSCEKQKDITATVRLCKCAGPSSLGYSPALVAELHSAQGDLLHVHGLWMYHGHAAHVVARREALPRILSPHGMLDSWALKNSTWKKRIVGWLYENRNLRSTACIHALCESEYQSIRAYGLTNPVCVIPNGVDLPDLSLEQKLPPWNSRIDPNKNVMLFLGRIHPKKGIENLIRACRILKDRKLKEIEQWHLVIAGWSQNGHEEQLKQIAHELNLGTDVSFPGPLYDNAKDAALQSAKAFILPSFSEGLPMAVLEAWSHSLPVIMTRQCNIPEGFKTGAAVEIQTTAESISQGLQYFMSLSVAEQEDMGSKGQQLVRTQFTWPKIATQMIEVYKWVLGQGNKPDCVRLD